jgi:membrane associated rhomboid family serine protease
MRTSLKILIFTTIGLSLIGGFVPIVQAWLALSWAGMERYYLWQPVSYLFVQPGPLSLGFFIGLGFNMYVLWMFGTSLLERCRWPLFYALYLGSGLVAGLASLAFPNVYLAGSTTAVYAILVAWMMLNPGSQVLLFFALPFKAHWLIAGLIGFTLFVDISAADWVSCVSLTASVLFGYIFSLIAWREQSPFSFLRPFERKILRLLEKKKQQPYTHSKIYDIKSGAPVIDDDQFMDAMLDKISRHGEESLSAAEKKRMKEISEKKR